MWYRLVFMTGVWYAKQVDRDDVEEMLDDGAMEMIDQGTVVAFCDDLGTFADEMSIDEGDIQLVAPEED